MLLDPKERDRFVEWLEQDANSNEQIVGQMQKTMSPPIEMLIKQKKAEIVACRVVAMMLRSMHIETIEGEPVKPEPGGMSWSAE